MTSEDVAAGGQLLLDLKDVSKTFPGLKALDGVSLRVRSGEVVAVVGHNGSGKSTLVKILAGVYEPDPGGDVGVRNEHGMIRATVGEGAELHFIHQDLALVPDLSTVENLDLARDHGARSLAPVDKRGERRAARELLERYGASFDVTAPVRDRSAAERAIIAIARAMNGWVHDRNILLLDEPTEALHSLEVEELFGAIRAAVARGTGVVFISHRLEEVLALADRIAVLRDGRVVAQVAARDVTRTDLLRLIAGDDADEGAPSAAANTAAIDSSYRLQVRGLRGRTVDGIDLDVGAGEVLGVSGLLGSGREEVAQLIFGAVPGTADCIRIDGRLLSVQSPAKAISSGVAYVPGARPSGIVSSLSVGENMTLPRLQPFRRGLGRLDRQAERTEVGRLVRDFEVKPAQPERRLGLFSGGNQQKAVLAKWLRNDPVVLLLEEPTQGVDVGSKATIYRAISRAAAGGTAVLISSSDTKELAALCDRVLVLKDGRVTESIVRPHITDSRLIAATL
jgi:ABC-type sugar transport system ATPase subunit